MFIDGKPVVHMVDEATHFCAASFLRNQSTKEMWKTIQHMWSLVYHGPPDYLVVDQGTTNTSKEMKDSVEAFGVHLDEAPIETPGAIRIVERYHAPLRLAYKRISADTDRQKSGQECLQLAVFAINWTVGPEGLCPALLVFGAISRPPRMTPAPSKMERAKLINRVMNEVAREQARRKIGFGLRRTTGQKGNEHATLLRKLPASCPVLVYRTSSKRWEGPFNFINIERELIVVQLERGRKMFRSSCVKPLTTPMNTMGVQSGDSEDIEEKIAEDLTGNEAGQKRSTILEKVFVSENPLQPNDSRDGTAAQFAKARTEEIRGLIDNRAFQITDGASILEGTHIFGSRFVDLVKSANTGIRYKSRLAAQNYGDEQAASIATKAPTVQQFTQRLLLSLAASVDTMSTHTRNITQAYLQSKTPLARDVYIRPPPRGNEPAP